MSIQEQSARYKIPGQKSSSSLVANRGNEEYDPFANEDDESENEQLTDTKHSQQESIRANNRTAPRRIIILTNPAESAEKSSSAPPSEQQSRGRSKSPAEHHRKHSDRRSRSPQHRSHNPSDRKRLRASSPDTSISNTVNHNDSANSDIISSSKYRRTSRTDNRTDLKYSYRQRSPLNGTSSKLLSTSSNNYNHYHSRKPTSARDEKPLDASDNYSNRRASKRDDYHSYREDFSRHHHSSSLSKYPARDYSASSHQSYNDRRALTSKVSDVPRHHTESSPQQTTAPNRTSLQTKIEASPVPSAPNKIESTNTNGSLKSIEPPKTNGSTTDNILMEEMLLDEEEEKKQSPVKAIDLDSLTIPDPSAAKTEPKEAPVCTTGTATTTTTTTAETSSAVTPPTAAAAVTTTATTAPSTPASSLTPSPTKKPYTLYKVSHTNHMTPPLSSRHKKPVQKELANTPSDSTTVTNTAAVSTTNKPSAEETFLRTSLDERISTLLGAPPLSSNKASQSSADQQLDTHINPLLPTTTTPSDKSTESPQDVNLLINATVKKGHEHSPLSKKLLLSEERRSTASKNYTSEWLASQKPVEAPLEELTAPPSLIVLPTLISSQPATTGTGETTMLGKLSEAMTKLIQNKSDTNAPASTDVTEEAVPISAKHLERIERRNQREKRQSEIAAIAKEALKPAFRRHDITKDEYKAIMKKVVTKATNANEVDQIRISKMIEGYVKKYRTLRERSASKISTVTNGNGS